MKPQQRLQALKELAEKLGITVSEQNFRVTGVPVKSGLCKVKEQDLFILDKHLSVHRKIDALADCLSRFPHESIYVVPAVRELLVGRVPEAIGPDPSESERGASGAETSPKETGNA
ncbi:MAG: hypothetical protein LJE65_06880 [Desulfobacteraceae bacterium]|nr:hypothetical protein [Desulfobacteraceae bacterium]